MNYTHLASNYIFSLVCVTFSIVLDDDKEEELRAFWWPSVNGEFVRTVPRPHLWTACALVVD